MAQPEHLLEEEAAELLRVSEPTLRLWRRKGEGPTYLKFGRSVRYDRADLDTFMKANRKTCKPVTT